MIFLRFFILTALIFQFNIYSQKKDLFIRSDRAHHKILLNKIILIKGKRTMLRSVLTKNLTC